MQPILPTSSSLEHRATPDAQAMHTDMIGLRTTRSPSLPAATDDGTRIDAFAASLAACRQVLAARHGRD